MTPQRKPFGAAVIGALLSLCIVLLAANLWRLNQPPRPDPRIVALAVRATVYAIPTWTPRVVEVTRVVEITAVPPAPTATLTPTLPPPLTSPSIPDAGVSAAPAADAPELAAARAIVPAADAAGEMAAASAAAAPPPPPEAEIAAPPGAAPDAGPVNEGAADEPSGEAQLVQVDAPLAVPAPGGGCPGASGVQYTAVPVAGGGLSHPDALHADLNLSLRGYTPTSVSAGLIDKDGPVDGDPPQLAGLFGDFRGPAFGQAYRVNDWDWGCGAHGCALGPLEHVAATLVVLGSRAGEPLGIPHRDAQIYGGGYKALVLYAEANRITLGYTREDSVANGYAVHLENICVDPNLLALYQSSNAAGRGMLPALREDELLGVAAGDAVLIAVRDRGVFFDPRSRLDWWQGF